MALTFAYITLGFAFIISAGYYSYKLIEILDKRRKDKFKDEKAEFLGDLYEIQIKWARRGEFAFSKAVVMIIESFYKDDDNTPPITQYGKDVVRQLEALAIKKGIESIEEEQI